jgi:polyhydroxybutyrate depolymerase
VANGENERMCTKCGYIVFIVILLSVLTIPSAAAELASQRRTVVVGDLVRSYHLYRPAMITEGAPVSLVMVLHGGFGTGRGAEESYGWDAVADTERIVVVYPDGTERAWNAGGWCCGIPHRKSIDDVGFLTQVLAEVGAEERIDRSRIFVTGMSNGALMAYRLACESTVPLAAIGPVAGTMAVPCASARPTSVLAIHGLADQHVPFAGGRPGHGVYRHQFHPAVPDVIRQWRTIDHCDPPRATTSGPVTTDASECADGFAVTVITVEAAGHQWPGGKPVPPAAARLIQLDQPSRALDATRVLWRFFEAHPRPRAGSRGR